MDRENLIPLLGLVGLVLAGAGMLYATSGADRPSEGRGPGQQGQQGKAKGKPPARPVTLLHKRDIGDRPMAPEGAPNFVVVTGCAVRRDALEPYGGPAGLTPMLARLAGEGAVFDDAVAAGVWSRESLAAMFTGKHALELGLVEAAPRPSTRTLHPKAKTVAEALAQRGWWTVAVNSSPPVSRPNSGLWQGFDHVRDAHPEGWKAQHRLTAVHGAQQAIRMMNEAPTNRPFFMQLMFSDSHKPIKVPNAESRPWADEGLPNPHYMATVRRLDDGLGFLMRWLEEQGYSHNTYLIFVADHGEGLERPATQGPAHGRFVGGSVAQVPWIVRGPGIAPGSHVTGLASGVDFAPTILGLAGITGGLDEDLSGLDLSPALREGKPTGRSTAVTDTWYHNANRAALWTADRQCQRDFGSQNLQGDGFVDGCFDRIADPDLQTPIEDAERMAELEAWRAARPLPEATPRPKEKARAKPQ